MNMGPSAFAAYNEPLLTPEPLWEDGTTTMEQLLHDHSDHLVKAVSELGVVKLGQLVGRDQRIIRLMDECKILTVGDASAAADWPQLWSQRLNIPRELLSVRSEGTARGQVGTAHPIGVVLPHCLQSSAVIKAEI